MNSWVTLRTSLPALGCSCLPGTSEGSGWERSLRVDPGCAMKALHDLGGGTESPGAKCPHLRNEMVQDYAFIH